jgi:hypothetical protein
VIANSPSHAEIHHDPFDRIDPIGYIVSHQRKLLAFRIVNERGDLHHREAIITWLRSIVNLNFVTIVLTRNKNLDSSLRAWEVDSNHTLSWSREALYHVHRKKVENFVTKT